MATDLAGDVRRRAELLFEAARRRARARRWRARLTRGCNELLEFAPFAESVSAPGPGRVAVGHIAIDEIVGSVGRSRAYDLHFLPLIGTGDERWLRVAIARLAGRRLPPVHLYRLGARYFVVDGHHRLSVAHMLGDTRIVARVTALDAGPLQPEPACSRLGYRRSSPAERPGVGGSCLKSRGEGRPSEARHDGPVRPPQSAVC